MKKSSKKFGIIGNPVEHSLSPAMHQAAYQQLKLPYTYTKTKLAHSQLKSFFKKLKTSDYAGLNVTVPFKESVLPFVNVISPEAKLIGAVNTLFIKDGKTFGFNTDGRGYLESLLREKKWEAKNKRIVILGAGGAARGILAALCMAGAKKVTLTNRTYLKAEALAREFQNKFKKTKIAVAELESKILEPIFQKTDLLVNTSSAGMTGNDFPSLPLEKLPKKALVSDIVYRPVNTPLLKAAKKLRLKTHAGLGMLLYQGALAFEIWTQHKAPIRVMKKALIKNL